MTEKVGSLPWKWYNFAILVSFFLILFGVLTYTCMTMPVHRWGDTSTYYMQISSIVYDQDIEYKVIDIDRVIQNRFDDLPAGLFLVKTNAGKYVFAKEFTYALFSAPFYSVLGDSGILFFNAFLFFLMVLMGFLYLKQSGNSPVVSFLVSLVFFTLSTAVVYLYWIHPEIYIMFLITSGCYSWFLYYANKTKSRYLYLTAIIFGLATVAKPPDFLIFFPFVFYELYNLQYKKAIMAVLIFLLPVILCYGFYYALTGAPTFYHGDRFGYASHFPFQDGYNATYEAGSAANNLEKKGVLGLFSFDLILNCPVNFFYYFFGKFSGMLWYYPLTGFALLSFLMSILCFRNQKTGNDQMSVFRQNEMQFLILLGIAFSMLFYLLIAGNNYLGGQHAVGNRYFYIFPAFLFLIKKIDIKIILPFILIGAITVIPIISDPVSVSNRPETHTYDFPYSSFPIEYTQLNYLPIWDHRFRSSEYTIYGVGGRSSFSENIIRTNETSQWVIKTTTNDVKISCMIFPVNAGKTHVVISTTDDLIDTNIDEKNIFIMNITLEQAGYIGKNYRLYPMQIESSDEVFFIPLAPGWEEKTNIQYLTGWYGKENWNGITTRWTSGNATFLFVSNTPRNGSLTFEASAFGSPKKLHIIYQNQIIAEYDISTTFTYIQVPVTVQKGMNVFQLYSPEGCKIPADISALNNDPRCLSIAIQNFTVINHTIL